MPFSMEISVAAILVSLEWPLPTVINYCQNLPPLTFYPSLYTEVDCIFAILQGWSGEDAQGSIFTPARELLLRYFQTNARTVVNEDT